MSWQDHAVCSRNDPRLWDGVRKYDGPMAGLDFTEAKALCALCPVSNVCLETYLADSPADEVPGAMRAGRTPAELKVLLRGREQVAA